MKTVRFNGRRAVPQSICAGVQMDNGVEQIMFSLPRLAEGQTETLHWVIGEEEGTVILDHGLWTVYDTFTEYAGEHECYIEIWDNDIFLWHSHPFIVSIADLPSREGGGGNYNSLRNKPRINGIELKGDKSLSELGIDSIFFAIYGQTTLADVNAAIAAGKSVYAMKDSIAYPLTNHLSTSIYNFCLINDRDVEMLSLKYSGWTSSSPGKFVYTNNAVLVNPMSTETPPASSNNTQLATTAFVQRAVSSISGMKIHICTSSEYDAVTRIPTIQNPSTDTFYLVPAASGSSPDLFVEWIYTNNAWEQFGSASIDLTGYARIEDVPTKVSDLQNDSGFITGYTETDPTVPAWAKASNKPTYTASEVGALPANTPIPTKVSDLTDDSGHYTKPSGGIPKTDLSSAVQASLDKADTALQGSDVSTAVEGWLEENITNPDSPPLDRSLSLSSAAAPADMVGELKSAIGYDEYLINNGQYTIRAEDLESGQWSYSAKAANAARARTKYLLPVRKGMSIEYSNATYDVYFGVLATPTSGSYLQSGWKTNSGIFMVLNDGFLTFIIRNHSDTSAAVNPADFDGTVVIKTDLSDVGEIRRSASRFMPRDAMSLLSKNLFIDSSGNVIFYQQSKCICIPLNPGDVVNITGNGSQTTWYAFLTSDELIPDRAAPFCSGCSRVAVNAEGSAQATAPNDAHYLGIPVTNGNGVDVAPAMVMFNGEPIFSEGKANAVDVAGLQELINAKASEAELSAVSAKVGSVANGRMLDVIRSANFPLSKLTFDDDGYLCLAENTGTNHKNFVYPVLPAIHDDIGQAGITFKIKAEGDVARVFFENPGGTRLTIHAEYATVSGTKYFRISFYSDAYTAIQQITTSVLYEIGTHTLKIVKVGRTLFVYINDKYCCYKDLTGYLADKVKIFGYAYRGTTDTAPGYYANIYTTEAPKAYVHMSLDDQIACLSDITSNAGTYSTIFENSTFAALKELHDEYGCVFTLELFKQDAQTNPTFAVANTTTAFKTEFSANAHWLKFAYHGPDPDTKPGDQSTADCIADMKAVYTAITNFAGTECIDRVPRISFFNCTKEQAIAMKTEGLIVGLLTADDNRASNVGLNATELAIMQAYDMYTDYTNGITYFRTEARLDSDPMTDLTAKYNSINNDNIMIIFAHGITDTTRKQRFHDVAEWLWKKGFRYDYPQFNC